MIPPDVDESKDGRIRLTVLGGYLGSGKTTWLRHQLHHALFEDALVIVNEAAETPVDDALLQRSSRLAVLAGGCACCAGKEHLISCLLAICDDRGGSFPGGAGFDRIVLETSGLADPRPIVEAVRNDPLLARHIVVSEVLITVDAPHAIAQLRREPLARRQVESADCIMITKLDETSDAQLKKLLATLQLLNPGAAVFGAIRGAETPLPGFDDTDPEILDEISGDFTQPPLFPARLIIDESIDWTAFSVWLSALLHARGDDIVRVKGVIRTPAGRLLVQTVRKTIQQPEILPEQDDRSNREDNLIVVIGRGYEADALKHSLHFFAGAKD